MQSKILPWLQQAYIFFTDHISPLQTAAAMFFPKRMQLFLFTIKMSNFICHSCLFLCALFALQRGKAGPRCLKPQQNGGHADSTATQPGGHRNAKSTSKSTHKHTHGHTHRSWQSFLRRQIQTHTHTPAHLLLSSHRRRSFHASYFKRTRAPYTSISSSCDKSGGK